MRRQRQKAFTLVELVIVIAIIGILAAIAIPRFIDIRANAYVAQRDGIIGSVRAGILTVASKNQAANCTGTFPPNLEASWNAVCNGMTGGTLSAAATACVAATPCFELVIPGGYVDGNWQQLLADGSQYKFTSPVNSPTDDRTCTYSSTNGTFTCS